MNYRQVIARQKACESRWLKIQSDLNHESGIYVLARFDENGFKYAYVGQAQDILKRLGQHLLGYQHIDLSLKKHGLFDEFKNPNGWFVKEIILTNNLEETEKCEIKRYADLGYQLRNKTSGGQGKGKSGIDDNKPAKGYHDGLKQGYLNACKDFKVYFEKYFVVCIKGKPGKVKYRKYIEFKNKLGL